MMCDGNVDDFKICMEILTKINDILINGNEDDLTPYDNGWNDALLELTSILIKGKDAPKSKYRYEIKKPVDYPQYVSCFNKQNTPKFEDSKIVFKTRPDAEIALESLYDLIFDYSYASVGDLFELSGNINAGRYMGFSWKDEADYGWKDISGAEVLRKYDGHYYIKFKEGPKKLW